MLNFEVFAEGLDKLINEYADRGFLLTEEKSKQWYEYMKNLSNTEYMQKIDKCLMTCNKVPFMADVLDCKEDEVVKRPNSAAYRLLE